MHFTLHLTAACNMRCSYCYSPPQPGDGMSEAIGRAALDLGADTGGGSCGIVFFGGEPLLHEDLIRNLVSYGHARERNQAGRFHFKLTTNGLLLDNNFLRFAMANDIMVAMSFDGVREAHDRHRLMPDGSSAYDILIERLKMLLAAKPYSSVLMVVNPDTAEFLCDSIALLAGLSCRYMIVSMNYAANWLERDFRVLENQLEKLAELYIKWTLEGRKFYLSPFEVKLSSHINRHCFQKERCELGGRQVSVDPRGFLYPCVQFVKAGPESRWCIGDVRTGINEDARHRIRTESEREKEACRDCALSARCNNSCGCLNWQTTGSVNEVSPALCRYEQMLIPITDRIGAKLYRKRSPLFLHKHYNAAYPVLSLLEDAASKTNVMKPCL